MNGRAKREIRNKIRLTYCLVDVLEYDVSNLKNDSYECDPQELMNALQETKDTLQNISDVIAEIEYMLYLDKFKGA